MRATAAVDPEQLGIAIKGAVTEVRREFEEYPEDVSLSGIDPRTLGGVAIAIDDYATVRSLLNEAWFHIADHVPAYTYGETWDLAKVDSTGAQHGITSSASAERPDRRLLNDVGVARTDKLVARLLKASQGVTG